MPWLLELVQPAHPFSPALFLATNYSGCSRRAVRVFEIALEHILIFMVASFLLVVIKTGVDWPQLLKGVFFFYIPGDREGITIVLGQLGAAVGVNMTFLYPYTLLARGWGKEHRRLKNFDLATSMFLPFVLATSLVIIACANTLYVQGIRVQGAVDAAHTLQPLVGLSFGRLISDLLLIDLFHSTLKCDMCRKVL